MDNSVSCLWCWAKTHVLHIPTTRTFQIPTTSTESPENFQASCSAGCCVLSRESIARKQAKTYTLCCSQINRKDMSGLCVLLGVTGRHREGGFAEDVHDAVRAVVLDSTKTVRTQCSLVLRLSRRSVCGVDRRDVHQGASCVKMSTRHFSLYQLEINRKKKVNVSAKQHWATFFHSAQLLQIIAWKSCPHCMSGLMKVHWDGVYPPYLRTLSAQEKTFKTKQEVFVWHQFGDALKGYRKFACLVQNLVQKLYKLRDLAPKRPTYFAASIAIQHRG